MSSLAELPELIGFFSYSRDDDESFKGTLSGLRDGIQRELSAQLGRSKKTFRLWQDQSAIAPGKLWESEIKTAIDQSVFFIPIVTPRSINSGYCKFEFELFLAREKAINRSDLIFPILYISVAALEDEAKWRNDPVLSTIGRRQYVDWRPLRHLDVQTTAVREQIERLCRNIVEALNEPWMAPEERQRMEEARARQQAEEETRRLEVEAKRRADEDERQRQAEAEAQQRADEGRLRQEAEAKRRADEAERRRRAEAEDTARCSGGTRRGVQDSDGEPRSGPTQGVSQDLPKKHASAAGA
jgi:TIR domain-containing protein